MAENEPKAKRSRKVSTGAVEREYQSLLSRGDLKDTKDFEVIRDTTTEGGDASWSDDVRTPINTMTLKSLFYSEDWVFIIVDLVASKIASQSLGVVKRTVVGGRTVETPEPNHSLVRMFAQPSDVQSYYEWMYCLVADLILCGNGIQYFAVVSGQLMVIPAEAINIIFDGSGVPKAYQMIEYQTGDGPAFNKPRVAQTFKPSEIIHIKRPNPSSYYWGLSPFVAGRKSVLFNRFSTEYLNNFYVKGATPGLALELDKDANQKAALRMLRSFEMAYTGRRNQRRTMILPKGVTAKQIAISLADQQLIQYINSNRETILGLLKVPPHEAGLQTKASLGSDEYKTALKNFWAATLIPTMKLIENGMQKYFDVLLREENFFIKFDLSDVEALQENESSKADLAIKLLSTHTLNEVRADLYDKKPLEGGDALPGQASGGGFGGFGGFGGSTPSKGLDPIPNLSQAPKDGPEIKEHPDSNHAKPVATEATPPSDGTDREKALSINTQRANTFVKNNESWFNNREQMIKKKAGETETEVSARAIHLFSELVPAMVSAVKQSLKEKGYRTRKTKAKDDDQTKDKPKTDVPSAAELKRRIRRAVDNFEEQWTDDSVKTMSSTVELGYGAALDLPFNLPNMDQIEALKLRGADGRRSILELRALDTFQNMTKTTTDRVLDIVAKGVDDNKTIEQIASDISNTFKDPEAMAGRAATIARTETLTAVSLGQAAAMKDVATVIPNLKKMWIDAGDNRVRDSHQHLQGEVKDHDAPFSNGLQFPRDPSGDASEVINCRCTWIMLPADEMKETSDDLDSGIGGPLKGDY